MFRTPVDGFFLDFFRAQNMVRVNEGKIIWYLYNMVRVNEGKII